MGGSTVAIGYTDVGRHAAAVLAPEDQVACLGGPRDRSAHTHLTGRRVGQNIPELLIDRRREGGAVHRAARLPRRVRVIVGHAQPALGFAEHSTPRTALAEHSTPRTTLAEHSTPRTTLAEHSTPRTTLAEHSTPRTSWSERIQGKRGNFSGGLLRVGKILVRSVQLVGGLGGDLLRVLLLLVCLLGGKVGL